MCYPAVAEERQYGDPDGDDFAASTDRLESFILDITHPRSDTRRGANGFMVLDAKKTTAWLREGFASGQLAVDDLTAGGVACRDSAADASTVQVPRAEWNALVDAVDDDGGTVANYRAHVAGMAARLVREVRSGPEANQ